ncbi:MAG: peptidoglycan DD-metalloendopeptidase family protein [Bacteroidales bacterium]|nr:peptidoglycan DD-metalloendopeptidase family protein [Bacteroidales bacterium]MBR2227311.1 peptidoglycan DD-metalloendopeptidase family protein [Bacteroidales bacterium]
MRGKMKSVRRRVGKALRYLAAAVTTAIGFYVLFSLLFSTEEEKRLQQENDLYATYYQDLREKERLVSDAVEGLEMKDDALYREIFQTEAPSVDAVTAADMISVSDSLSESFYLSYSASKSESLRMMAASVEENLKDIYRIMVQRRDSLPPLTLPLEGMSYVQTGASVGPKHNPLYKVEVQHDGIDLVAPQGSPVFASANGVVRQVIRSNKGLGNIVEIDHRNGYVTRYALLGDISVPQGRTVKRGQKIGTVGISSTTFAPHLHYEVLRDGNVLDPVHFLFASVGPDEYAKMLYMSVSTRQSLD